MRGEVQLAMDRHFRCSAQFVFDLFLFVFPGAEAPGSMPIAVPPLPEKNSIGVVTPYLHHHSLPSSGRVIPYVPAEPSMAAQRHSCVPFPMSSHRYQLHPLVAPHVSHFSQVPLRTMVKFWHSEHELPV